MFEIKVNDISITCVQGDITKAKTQVIVNAANRHLVAGGGVDEAIHKAAGHRLQFHLNSLKTKDAEPVTATNDFRINIQGKELPTGKALLTPSFDLAEYGPQYIIHCVGPIYALSKNPQEELYSCYQQALEICKVNNFRSISFSAISTGIYGYPLDSAAAIAVAAIVLNCLKTSLKECQFVLFEQEVFDAFKHELSCYSSIINKEHHETA